LPDPEGYLAVRQLKSGESIKDVFGRLGLAPVSRNKETEQKHLTF